MTGPLFLKYFIIEIRYRPKHIAVQSNAESIGTAIWILIWKRALGQNPKICFC